MKKYVVVALILFICYSQSKAMIITVDNNYPSLGDYQTIENAINAASAGDTILLFPSQLWYPLATINKPITLMGAGFASSTTNNSVQSATVYGDFLISPAGSGSCIESINMEHSYITIDANDVIINRCSVFSITIMNDHSGTIIKCNKIHNENDYYSGIKIGSNNILCI